MRLDLNPEGGSMVILTEFYNADTGNLGVGIEVIQSLNSGCSEVSRLSTITSSLGIQDKHKWQFYSRIHRPFSFPFSIRFSAGFC